MVIKILLTFKELFAILLFLINLKINKRYKRKPMNLMLGYKDKKRANNSPNYA